MKLRVDGSRSPLRLVTRIWVRPAGGEAVVLHELVARCRAVDLHVAERAIAPDDVRLGDRARVAPAALGGPVAR